MDRREVIDIFLRLSCVLYLNKCFVASSRKTKTNIKADMLYSSVIKRPRVCGDVQELDFIKNIII
jgi:hypothetical protein